MKIEMANFVTQVGLENLAALFVIFGRPEEKKPILFRIGAWKVD